MRPGNRENMNRAGGHEPIPNILRQVSALADDQAEKQAKRRLAETIGCGDTDPFPPVINPMPEAPSPGFCTGRDETDGVGPGHRCDGIDALSFKIPGVVESSGVQ